jgi:hypothetical protein
MLNAQIRCPNRWLAHTQTQGHLFPATDERHCINQLLGVDPAGIPVDAVASAPTNHPAARLHTYTHIHARTCTKNAGISTGLLHPAAPSREIIGTHEPSHGASGSTGVNILNLDGAGTVRRTSRSGAADHPSASVPGDRVEDGGLPSRRTRARQIRDGPRRPLWCAVRSLQLLTDVRRGVRGAPPHPAASSHSAGTGTHVR